METSSAWKRSATIYCGIVFIASWSLWIAAGRSGDATTEVSFLFLHLDISQKSVLIVLGSVVPGIVGLIMKLLDDQRPLRSFLIQLGPPKSPKLLYVFAVFAPLAVNLTMFMAQENLNLSALAGLRLGDFTRLFFVNILLGPLWEEIGWRGYLLPTLSKQIGLGRAALAVGLIWGSWHFVLYHSVLQVSVYSYLISFGVIVAMAVVLAVLYSASNNMLVLPILFHTSWNAATNWVIGVEPRYDVRPIVLQAVGVWVLAGLAWFWYCWLQGKPSPPTSGLRPSR
jgi:membrane protease YdiL (CAAX protease family)